MKSFVVIENVCMFVSILDQGINIIRKYGHFYVLLTALIYKIRLFKSHVSRSFSNVMVPWSEARGEQSFLFYINSNFVDTMTKENEICKGTNNSSPSTTTNARKASTSKTEKLLKQLSEKVITTQRAYEQKCNECAFMRYFIARNMPSLFSYFEKNHPIDSQNWEKLYKMETQLKNI